jgi:cobalt-zinc-cadmium efflux system outer membrane protein
MKIAWPVSAVVGLCLAFIARAEQPGLPPPVPAAGLSLGQVEAMALAANPALARAAARTEAARGTWLQVGLHPNPVIGYSAEDMNDDGTAGKQGGFVAQRIVLGKKLQLNRQVAGYEVAKAEQRLAAMQYRVLTDVRQAFYDALIAQRKLELTGEISRIAEQAVQAAVGLRAAQEGSRVDELRARLELDATEILANSARNQHAAAWRRLAAVVGHCELVPQPLEGNLEEAAEHLTFEEILQRLLEQSPEMAAASADYERAKWAVHRAKAQIVPDVDVALSLHHDCATGDEVAGVEVALPLPLFDRNQGGIHRAGAELAAAERNLQRIQLALRHRLAALYPRYADGTYQVEKYDRVILPRARETLDAITVGYRAGEFGYLGLLTAQRTFFQTSLAYLDGQRELWAAKMEIDGLLLRDSLDVD